MNIGIQWDVRVYLKGCDGGQLICKIAKFFTAPLLSLMLTPAYATIEAVSPISGGYFTIFYNGVTVGQYATALEGCDAWLAGCNAYYGTLGHSCYDFRITPSTEIIGAYYCSARNTGTGSSSGNLVSFVDAICPVPPVNPQNNYVYNRTIRMCERTVANKCPIDELPDFPLPTDDSCTKSLEKGAGKDVDNVCPPLDDRWTKPNGGQLQCLADKISKLGLPVPYTEPSATIRTVAYQKHFVKLWKWKKDFNKLTDLEKQACVSDVSKVDAELAMHGIDAPPSKKEGDAPHVLGKAIDIPRGVKNALIKKVSNSYYITPIPPFCLYCPIVPVHIGDVQDYVNSTLVNPPACNLRWGGRFDPYDPVHFQLP